MRVCFLTHYFPPEVGAPQTRIGLLAQTLAERGEQVTVHTGFPHYPDGGVAAPYRNRPWLRERRGGVDVIRSAVYPAANRGFARRLLDHAAFASSALATVGLTGPADVVVAETPPLATAVAGAAYAAAKHAAYVVNVADLWPASAVALGALRDRRAIAAATALESFAYRRADLITAPTEGIVARLRVHPAAAGKVRRLWPVVDLGRFDPAPPPATQPPASSSSPAPLRLLYAGTIGLAQGLATLIDASALAGPLAVQTTIVGDGADAACIRRQAQQRRLANVTIAGKVPAARVPALYAASDAAAVLLRDLELFEGALPTKTLEAMAAGRPLIMSARGEAAELTRRARAGIVVAPGDAGAVADACMRLHAQPQLRLQLGAAGRMFAERHFGAQRSADAWSDALTAAISRRPTRRRSARRR